MQSFFFWLTVAAALGALLGTILRPGIPEIAIVFAVLNVLFYAKRSLRRKGKQVA
jgi:hypothetical protein